VSVITKTANPGSRFTISPNGTASDKRLRGPRLHVWLLYREQADGFDLDPGRAARRLGISEATVKRALRGLAQDGLIERTRTRLKGGMFGPTSYLVRHTGDVPGGPQTPGPQPQRTGSPQPGADPGPDPSDTAAHDGPVASDETRNPTSEPQLNRPPVVDETVYNKKEVALQDEKTAPDARRAPRPDARADASGPGAAPGSIPPEPSPHTTAPPASLRAVVEALPHALRLQLPRGPLPRTVQAVLAEQLAGRTVAQLVERVERRWILYGYEIDADPRAGGTGLRRPVGVLTTLLRHGQCPDPRCEDGVSIDTFKPCPRCQERAAAHRDAARTPQAPPDPDGPPAGPDRAPQAPAHPGVPLSAPAATGGVRIPRDGPGARPARAGAPGAGLLAEEPSWKGCWTHPGAGKRVDPVSGAGVCAGCWSSRFDPDEELSV
jgi:hypothetical protein